MRRGKEEEGGKEEDVEAYKAKARVRMRSDGLELSVGGDFCVIDGVYDRVFCFCFALGFDISIYYLSVQLVVSFYPLRDLAIINIRTREA